MASCYICGCSGATQRRWVPVARRTFVSFGRRGNPRFGGGGTTAPRTVCSACAELMDRSGATIALVVIVAVVGFVVYCNLFPVDQHHTPPPVGYEHRTNAENYPRHGETPNVVTEENLGLDPAAPWPPPVAVVTHTAAKKALHKKPD